MNVSLAQVNIGSTFPPAKIGSFQTLSGVVSFFLPKILILGGVIFFILIIVAGVGVLGSAGSSDAHAQEKARGFLTYSIIGLIIMFSAYWILQIINYLTQGALSGLLGS